jgi:hypothetical protein
MIPFHCSCGRIRAMPKGGRFAALEQPPALAHEIRGFFRPLRDRTA